jgi:hypothetical protein
MTSLWLRDIWASRAGGAVGMTSILEVRLWIGKEPSPGEDYTLHSSTSQAHGGTMDFQVLPAAKSRGAQKQVHGELTMSPWEVTSFRGPLACCLPHSPGEAPVSHLAFLLQG